MCAWEGGPVGRGPPPPGSWGASQELPGGGPGPKLQGSIPPTSPCRPFEFASKFMSMLISIFGRFGLDLGPLLGVIFGHVGAFFGPSWSRNRLRIYLSSKTLFFFHETLRFPMFLLLKHDPKMGPRSTQDRSKMDPRSSWVAFFSS